MQNLFLSPAGIQHALHKVNFSFTCMCSFISLGKLVNNAISFKQLFVSDSGINCNVMHVLVGIILDDPTVYRPY